MMIPLSDKAVHDLALAITRHGASDVKAWSSSQPLDHVPAAARAFLEVLRCRSADISLRLNAGWGICNLPPKSGADCKWPPDLAKEVIDVCDTVSREPPNLSGELKNRVEELRKLASARRPLPRTSTSLSA